MNFELFLTILQRHFSLRPEKNLATKLFREKEMEVAIVQTKKWQDLEV